MIILRQKHYAAGATPTVPTSTAAAPGTNPAGAGAAGGGFFNKVGDFAKKAWNGENLTGNKTGNRAAIIGAGALATAGTAALINKKRNEKKEEESKYKNYSNSEIYKTFSKKSDFIERDKKLLESLGNKERDEYAELKKLYNNGYKKGLKDLMTEAADNKKTFPSNKNKNGVRNKKIGNFGKAALISAGVLGTAGLVGGSVAAAKKAKRKREESKKDIGDNK